MKPKVTLVARTKNHKILSAARCTRILRAALRKFGRDLKNQNVEAIFLSSAEMQRLNFTYRKKRKTTDVLSFEMHREGLLGLVAIDLKVAARQAKDYQHSLQREAQELFVHGLLHLLGFDHQTKRQANKMAAAENWLNQFWTKS